MNWVLGLRYRSKLEANDSERVLESDRMPHYCRICDRERANEKFSGKGHATHICKDCMRLPREKRKHIEKREEISNILNQTNISEKNLVRLMTLTESLATEVAKMAALVLEIGRIHPRKKGRLTFLTKERRDLLALLEGAEMGEGG
jgi:hypothetical protein